MFFPLASAWLHYLALARAGSQVNPVQQGAYLAGKVIQFGLPVVFLVAVERRRPRLTRPRFDGLLPGLGFGLAVSSVMLGLYFVWLRHTPLFRQTPAKALSVLEEFGLSFPAGYFALGFYVSVIHSLLEEYYWRWFVFGRLRQLTSFGPAVVLSSLAFMAHHVVVLYVYLPGQFWSAVVPFSLAIAVGGAAWAWLYEKTGTIYSAWLSHLLIDGAVILLGYDLLRGG
jgi:membrane protease YdiL (CAAX protease family)